MTGAHLQYGGGSGKGRNGTYVAFGRALLGYYQDPTTHLYALTDVDGAGAQRSNGKLDVSNGSAADLGYATFYYHGPQGGILRVNNIVRCVRDDE